MSTMNAFFGQYGGQYVPAELIPALNQLETEFGKAQKDPDFRKELKSLLCDYAGRPTPLTPCRNLTRGTKTKFTSNAKICCTAAPTRLIRYWGRLF